LSEYLEESVRGRNAAPTRRGSDPVKAFLCASLCPTWRGTQESHIIVHSPV
jgi:hypothetical protein